MDKYIIVCVGTFANGAPLPAFQIYTLHDGSYHPLSEQTDLPASRKLQQAGQGNYPVAIFLARQRLEILTK